MGKVELTLQEGEEALRIDPYDLSTCLTDHPDLYYHVADRHVSAVAERDRVKLDLEEETAKLDGDLRAQAAAQEKKTTEALLQQQLRTMPKLQRLNREYLEARITADRWGVLKEAFQQRSFMLRELVQREIAQLQNLGLERGTASSRAGLADASKKQIEAARRERYGR